MMKDEACDGGRHKRHDESDDDDEDDSRSRKTRISENPDLREK